MNRLERIAYHFCFLVGFVVLFLIGVPIIINRTHILRLVWILNNAPIFGPRCNTGGRLTASGHLHRCRHYPKNVHRTWQPDTDRMIGYSCNLTTTYRTDTDETNPIQIRNIEGAGDMFCVFQ